MARVRHERQRYSWDCGLACTRMILKSYDRNMNVLQEICKTFGIKTSVWTVDIASILTSYKIRYLFVTKRAGVDYSYENEPFFAHNFKNDAKRVQKLFNNSEEIKLNIQQRSISENEIIQHLDGGQPIIILLDWSKLKETNSIFGCLGSSKGSYQGHYVVLISYDDKKECFYYLDPERNSRKRKMKKDALERARKSYGTDEDLILIYDD